MTIKTKFNINEVVFIYSIYLCKNNTIKYDKIKIDRIEITKDLNGFNILYLGFNKEGKYRSSYYCTKRLKDLKKRRPTNIFGKKLEKQIIRFKKDKSDKRFIYSD